MIAISLKDTTGVKHAEDYIKLSVADSQLIYPTKVSTMCVCGSINNMSVQKDQACPRGQFVNYISMLTAEDICDMQ